jgi:hypothetical protein
MSKNLNTLKTERDRNPAFIKRAAFLVKALNIDKRDILINALLD